MAEDMLKDEIAGIYGNDVEKMSRITMNKVFTIQKGIYVMRVPGALLYMIGDNIEKVLI